MMKPKLVFNDTPAKTRPIESIACNLVPSLCRMDKLEGRDYLVVPMVILTEGVHTGSEGPLLYPNDELSKTPAVWNHKPVVVYHPTMNGVGVSACDQDVINTRKVGLMMNTKFENGRLKSEAWIEQSRADQVDERIMSAINGKQMMELSTGVYVDSEDKAGEWNGEAYNAVARNYRPDHLALLPDKIGACSIKDGAGFLRNEKVKSHPKYSELITLLQELGIQDVRISDRTVEGAIAGGQDQSVNNKQKKTMEKKAIVDAIIGNSGWEETDRETLMGLSEDKLKSIQNGITPPTKDDGEDDEETPPVKKDSKPGTETRNQGNQSAEVVTLESYIASAPREMQDILNNGVEAYNEEKIKLVKTILENKKNTFAKEDLENMPLGNLKRVAQLAAVEAPPAQQRQPDYSGQGSVSNTSAEEALTIPTLNFEKK